MSAMIETKLGWKCPSCDAEFSDELPYIIMMWNPGIQSIRFCPVCGHNTAHNGLSERGKLISHLRKARAQRDELQRQLDGIQGSSAEKKKISMRDAVAILSDSVNRFLESYDTISGARIQDHGIVFSHLLTLSDDAIHTDPPQKCECVFGPAPGSDDSYEFEREFGNYSRALERVRDVANSMATPISEDCTDEGK